MDSRAIPLPDPGNRNAFLAALLPNRGRTRFMRGAILLFLGCGGLGSIAVAATAFSEWHARHSWPVADGHVTAVEVRSYTGPSSSDHVSHYFVEYEVRFAVPVEQCLTGTTIVLNREPPLCEGIARSRVTDSPALANRWGERHRFNPAVGVLHDPHGPGVKIVGEPASVVYSWKDIILMSGWMIFFSACFMVTQRRLRFLETLPENTAEDKGTFDEASRP